MSNFPEPIDPLELSAIICVSSVAFACLMVGIYTLLEILEKVFKK